MRSRFFKSKEASSALTDIATLSCTDFLGSTKMSSSEVSCATTSSHSLTGSRNVLLQLSPKNFPSIPVRGRAHLTFSTSSTELWLSEKQCKLSFEIKGFYAIMSLSNSPSYINLQMQLEHISILLHTPER